MAHTHTGAEVAARPRVRDQAREALVLMTFSAATSVVLAVGLLLLVGWGE